VTTVETRAPEQVRKFPLTTLIAMVVGRLFSRAELVILVIAVVGFVTGVVALATGAITI
jgi:hypothetical protein